MAITGNLTAAGASAAVPCEGTISVAVWRSSTGNKTGMVTVERSADQGTTWVPVFLDAFGDTTFRGDAAITLIEPEPGMLYRVRAANVASGETINYRIAG